MLRRWTAILVDLRDMSKTAQPGLIGLPKRGSAREVERAERIAVIGMVSGYDDIAFWLPDRDLK
jgi:hypothetical protein